MLFASPGLTAQLQSFHAQIHTGDATQFYTCVGTSRLEFEAVCGKWCALFHVNILFFTNISFHSHHQI